MDRASALTGTGSYVPDNVLTNEDLEDMVDTTDEWIHQRTGIRERRIADDDQAASDLGVEAARRALDDAELSPEDVDQVIVGTLSPDTLFPATGCWIQDKLGMDGGSAFDVSAACSGFIYAFSVAHGHILSGVADTVLVVGTEVISKFTNYDDRNTSIIFGDAAGAWVLQDKPDQTGETVRSLCLHADGEYQDILGIPGGGSRNPVSKEVLEKNMQYMQMDGPAVFKEAVRRMQEGAIEALEEADMDSGDIDWVICHQANVRIIRSVRDKLDLDDDKMIVNIEKYGNTSAASIPLAYDEARRSGKIERGDNILMVAFGGGLTWASSIITV